MALLANVASVVQFGAVIAAVSPAVLWPMAGPLPLACLALIGVAWPGLRAGRQVASDTATEAAFKISHALVVVCAVALTGGWPYASRVGLGLAAMLLGAGLGVLLN